MCGGGWVWAEAGASGIPEPAAPRLCIVQRRVRAGETLGGDAMAGQQSEGPDRRNDALWLRLTIGGMLLCLLIYGCWQAAAWFAASFPRDFR
jgi:hypothetical protein